MIKIKNIVMGIHAVGLLLLSFYFLFLFLASGHGLNFKDFSQLKLLFELFIFFIASISLFFKKQNFLFGKTVNLILLLFVQIAFIDVFIEVSEVAYGENKPILALTLFILFFMCNLFLIFMQFEQMKKPKR